MTLIDTDIALLLEQEGVGTVGSDIFAGIDQPSVPDNAIFVVATGTYQPQSPNLDYSYPTVQISVRSAKGMKQECDNLADVVINKLHGLTNAIISGNRYVQIFQNSGPVSFLEDGTMRPKNIINFSAIRTTNS